MAENSQHVSAVVEHFLTYLQYRKNRSQSTISTYRSTLRFFMEFIGDCQVNELTVKMVDDYAYSLTVMELRPKSYRNRIVPIRSFFKYLYLKDLTDIRPDRIEVPSDPEQEANFLSPEEQDILIKSCRDLRERAIIKCLLRSGIRVSELINAHEEDLYDRSLLIRKGKGGKPRITFITEAAEQAIKDYHSSLSFKPQWLFCGATGNKLSRQYVHRLVTNVAKRSKIEKHISPHTLRHSYATTLLMNGARIEDVQPMMGHKNIRTTQIYMHFTNDYLHKQYDKYMIPTPRAAERALT